MIVGYTSGVYDMFHIGHLNILKNAKSLCDFLIVGVSTDEVVIKNKNKCPIIPYLDRVKIVESIKYVDLVIPQDNYEAQGKIDVIKKYKVNILFVGSDWKGTEKWNNLEKELLKINCKVIYLPHTDGISSSILRNIISTEKNKKFTG